MALIRTSGTNANIDGYKIFSGTWTSTSYTQNMTSATKSENFSGPNGTITFGDIIFTCLDAYQIKCNVSGKLYTASLNGQTVAADTVFARNGSESCFIFIAD